MNKWWLVLILFILVPFANTDALTSANCSVVAVNNGPILICANSNTMCQGVSDALDEGGLVFRSCGNNNTSCLVRAKQNRMNQTECFSTYSQCQSSAKSDDVLPCTRLLDLKQGGQVYGYELEVVNSPNSKQGTFSFKNLADCQQSSAICNDLSSCEVIGQACQPAYGYHRGFQADFNSKINSLEVNINGQAVIDLAKAMFELDEIASQVIAVSPLVTIESSGDDSGSGDDDGQTCPNDQDCDGFQDNDDNCPTINNPRQEDDNKDLLGNFCDPQHPDNNLQSGGNGGSGGSPDLDLDKDGIINSLDPCPKDPDPLCQKNIVVDCSQPGAVDDPETNCLRDPLETECYLDFQGNQVCETNNVFTLIYKVVRGLTTILIMLSVVAIIYAGLQFVTAQGSDTKITNAKKTMTNVLIGVALILGSRIIVEIINAIRLTL